MALTKQDLADIKEVVVDAVNESFEVLSAPRFDALETRMDRLEGRMDGLEGRMGGIEGRMDGLETRMDRQEKEFRAFRDETNAHFGRIDTQLQTLTDKVSMLDDDVKALYGLLEAYQQASPGDKVFAKLSLEKKLLKLHTELLETAKQAGISLPH